MQPDLSLTSHAGRTPHQRTIVVAPHRQRPTTAELQASAGSVEVAPGTAGLWHDGFVPYACYELRREPRAATVILRRGGAWRVHETFLDHRPQACDPEP